MLAPLFNQVIDKIDLKQFALPGRSTTHALVYLLHCILEALDNSHCYARIFFTDFTKGFDLVDHSVLLSELRDLGVHEALITWIGAFLTGRSQQVKFGSALSNSVIPRGGIPQGTRLAPLLFAILVNNLVKDWKTRVKYVDDLSVLEIIPRSSTSMLPFVARDICSYASSHGMKLNPSKCKELRIDFLQYKPSDLPPLQMSGSIIEQVSSYKLLGVHLSHNLSWSIHCDYIVKRARKRLYVLRVLMKSGLPPADLIQVYCSLVRPILEYASPVWAALPNCLVQLVESVQKSALRIIFPDCSYESALVRCGLPTLLSRRDEACRRFISNIKESGFLSHLLPQPTNVAHGYGLRSGFSRSEFRFVRTDRLSNFVTHSYNRI